MDKKDVAKLHITRVAVNNALISDDMTLDQAKPYITEVVIASTQPTNNASTDPVKPVDPVEPEEEQPVVNEEQPVESIEPKSLVEDPGIEMDDTVVEE